jgi:hypothetical protein
MKFSENIHWTLSKLNNEMLGSTFL